jgi:hypothetical protein
MIRFKSVTMKNFLSVGNVTQAVNLDQDGLTLVLGENLDQGGGGSRNGVGKTTLIQAIFFALYGIPLTNIKKDNLITKPDVIPYPSSKIRYRHYGRTLEKMIKLAADYPEGEEKRQLVTLVANHMKKSFMNWNKDNVDDRKIFDDLSEYTNGKIALDAETIKLMETKAILFRKTKPTNNTSRYSK